MHILLQHNALLPVSEYGGTERVVWWLGKCLSAWGHKVTFLVKEGSKCSFARVIAYNPALPVDEQIPEDVDIVHLHSSYESTRKPQVVTVHGNPHTGEPLQANSIFVSENHAQRYGAKAFVHNGLDFSEYGKPDFTLKRKHVHFLGKAAWRVKNVKGAIALAKASHHRLVVMGGHRLNFKMGFRFTLDWHVRFYGMVGGKKKNQLLNQSQALLFPVLWHEPFGIAITESLYMGCPVIGTPYGSLPELVVPAVGFLSNKASELVAQLQDLRSFDAKTCHEYARDLFSAEAMTRKYLQYYETVLAGHSINLGVPQTMGHTPKFLPYFD